MVKKRLLIAGLLIVVLLLGACGQKTPTEAPGEDVDLPPEAATKAERALSGELDVPPEEVQIVSYERQEWPTACLGLQEANEVCAQVITPGWLVTLEAQGKTYVYHTDEDGDIMRLAEE